MRWREKNIVEPERQQIREWHIRIACWLPKATNTNSQYLIIIAFLLQKWLHESISILRSTYIACLVIIIVALFIFNVVCGSWKYKFYIAVY